MITGINHITVTTKDVNRSFNFYRDVLAFKPLCKWNNGAYFLVGELWFCLNYAEKLSPARDYTHLAFDVSENDFKLIKDRIIMSNANVFKDNLSEGESLYFTDPDGHKLEIHVGNWQSRITSKKQNPGSWENVEFFV